MTWLRDLIAVQRAQLTTRLESPMKALAEACASSWANREQLDQILMEALPHLPICQLVYAINTQGIQVSSNVGRRLVDPAKFGQDLTRRPFLNNSVPHEGFRLSDVYIAPNDRRSCITGLQPVLKDAALLGFVAADFYLRDLPLLDRRTKEGQLVWRQIKGDPAIRALLFQQERARSAMDNRIDDVINIINELVCERGVFHAKLHLSSSRATLWSTEDPYRYHVHVLDEIIDPAVCMAYPIRPYPKEALISPEQVRPVLEQFKRLREADETIYLRSSSLNVFNGMVGLTFSCDGAHYMPAEEFLLKDDHFWFGSVPN